MSFGAPEKVLQLVEEPTPRPPARCVLVRIRAAGVGLPDLLMTRGVYPLVKSPPVSPGQEVVGEVVAVGDDSKFAVGDRVMGLAQYQQGFGGYADHCLMMDHRTCIAPPFLNDEEAAGFVIPFKTAYGALVTRTELRHGETLLVLGGAGSSGCAAIQLGKRLGATVIAIAGSEDKLSFCRDMGADHAVSYKAGDVSEAINDLTGGRGANVVFDPVGGTVGEQSTKCIARYGRIGLVGFASGSWPRLDPLDMVLKNYSAVGVLAGALSSKDDAQAYERLCDMASRREIRTPIGRVFSFEEVHHVMKLLEEGPPPGKMIIKIGDLA